MSAPIVILLGCLGVLAFDTLGALVIRGTELSYGVLTIGSFAIYLAVAYIASDGSVATGAAAGAILALVDATAGWAISSRLGMEYATGDLERSHRWMIAAFVVAAGAVIGALGGLLA